MPGESVGGGSLARKCSYPGTLAKQCLCLERVWVGGPQRESAHALGHQPNSAYAWRECGWGFLSQKVLIPWDISQIVLMPGESVGGGSLARKCSYPGTLAKQCLCLERVWVGVPQPESAHTLGHQPNSAYAWRECGWGVLSEKVLMPWDISQIVLMPGESVGGGSLARKCSYPGTLAKQCLCLERVWVGGPQRESAHALGHQPNSAYAWRECGWGVLSQKVLIPWDISQIVLMPGESVGGGSLARKCSCPGTLAKQCLCLERVWVGGPQPESAHTLGHQPNSAYAWRECGWGVLSEKVLMPWDISQIVLMPGESVGGGSLARKCSCPGTLAKQCLCLERVWVGGPQRESAHALGHQPNSAYARPPSL